ncbi:MAG: hypothetical protein PHN80_14475 [Hespellia sp.]|nr:hypothetical protein [Hespellia sp.]
MNKKNPYKFTISFNENNPQHVQAVMLLNQFSRGEKADYIARASAYYEGQDGSSGAMMDKNLICQLIRQVMAEEQKAPAERAAGVEKQKEEIQDVSEQTELETISSPLLKNISRNMSAFRR